MINSLRKIDLLIISEFNSGSNGLGIEYYKIYELKNNNGVLIINCSGVAVGWEFDNWEIVIMNKNDQRKFITDLGIKSAIEK